MANNPPNEQQPDMAAMLKILVDQQAQLITEMRKGQEQMSALAARIMNLEGLAVRAPGDNSGDPSVPSNPGLDSSVDDVEMVSASASAQGVSVLPTASQSRTPEYASGSKGKGKELAGPELVALINSAHQPRDTESSNEPALLDIDAREDEDAVSAALYPSRMHTPVSISTNSERPISVPPSAASSAGFPVPVVPISPEPLAKRKREISFMKTATAPILYGKGRSVRVARSSTNTRKASFAPPPRKRRRVEVLIEVYPDTRERMRRARPLQEVLDELDDENERSDIYDDIFGSDLSDLTDLDDEDETDVSSYIEEEAVFTTEMSEFEVEDHVQVASSSSDSPSDDAMEVDRPEGRPPRRNVPRPNYTIDYGSLQEVDLHPSDPDYIPGDSQEDLVAGSSSRPHGSHTGRLSRPTDKSGPKTPSAKAKGKQAVRLIGFGASSNAHLESPNKDVTVRSRFKTGLLSPVKPRQTKASSSSATWYTPVRREATKSPPGKETGLTIKLPKPNSSSSKPKDEGSKPKAESSKLTEESSKTKSQSPKFKDKSTKSKDKSSKSKDKGPEPKDESSKPKDESKPLRLRSDVKEDKPQMQLVTNAGRARRLDGYEPLRVGLDPRIRDVLVTRKFMSETYGGSPQPLYPTISEAKRAALGGHQHKFVFPMLKMNPEVPLVPGRPGLLCRALDYVPWGDDEIKLVVGIGEALWAYMGDYTSTRTESLSKEEWVSLPEHTKQAWANDIATRDKYVPLRARIYLRELLGREPTEVEVEDQSQIVKLDRSEPTEAQLQQIISAYSAGHETIHIWRFECVRYDEDFQRELVRKFKSFVPKSQRSSILSNGGGSSGRRASDQLRRQPDAAADEKKAPRSPSKRTDGASPKAGSSTGPGTAAEGRRKHKSVPRKAAKGSKPGVLPSPPNSPPQSSSDNPGDDILANLRELWSAGRPSPILDHELAVLLHERRHGIRGLKTSGKISEHQYDAMKSFAAQYDRGWED